MKKVRQLLSVAVLLIAAQLFASNHPPLTTSSAYVGGSHNLHRFSSSLAIDTYGYFNVRVWIDGVLINRRPMDYIEVPTLRPGYRLVDVEIVGHRGSQFISQNIYIQPNRWSLLAVENGPRHDWFVMNTIQTQPFGYYYNGGRRQSVKIAYRRPTVQNQIIYKKNHGQYHKNHPSNPKKQVEIRGGRGTDRDSSSSEDNRRSNQQDRTGGRRSSDN